MKPACSYLPECVAGTTAAEAQAWVASAPELARRAALGDFDDQVLAWLTAGFRRHVDGEPIEAALRLDRASRTRARDDALRRAAAMLALGSDDAWPIAGRLAQAVARQGRLRSGPTTPLEDALAQAFAAGVGVPSTQRHLYRIIY